MADSPAGIVTRPMARSLDDPTFASAIPAIDANLSYRVEFPGGQSGTFRVAMFEYPAVKRIDARLAFPSWAGLKPKTVENVRHVAAGPNPGEAGLFTARFAQREPGPYRATATVTAADGSAVGSRDAGWCEQPARLV